MKKSIKRSLSLLLAAAMILSLGVLPASAAGIDEGEEIDAAYPAQQFSYYEPGGLNIDVKAPAGALPRGTTMEVSRLANLAPVQNAVDRAEDLDGAVVLAADISFWHEGEEVEPVEGSKILVTMTAPEIAEVFDPVVVHVPDGDPTVAERVEPLPNDDEETLMLADQIAFEAEDFSVYAIIDGSSGENARLKVIFMNGETELEVMYLKQADVDRDQVDKAIFDPGVPVDGGKLFMGWTMDNPFTFESEAFSIEQVREKAVAALAGIEEGAEEASLTFYAKMFKAFYLYYAYPEGEEPDVFYVTFKTQVAQVIGDSANFTVNADYTPTQSNMGMVGWYDKAMGEDSHVYKNGDPIDVTKDTTLLPKVVEGCWIHFFENDGEEGGASYTPPVFVPGGENASSYRPSKNPTRPGYTFDDWYTTATGTEKFNFNQVFENPPENGYEIYAHWTPNPEASYKIVIWAQSVNDDKNAESKTYDYVTTVDVSGVPSGTKITDDVVAPYTNYGNAFFDVTDLEHGSKAFKFSNWAVKNGVGTDKDEVSPANNTVVNVYYDRMLFTVKFTGVSGGSSETYYLPVESGENVYGLIDGEYVRLTATSDKWIKWEKVDGTLAVPDTVSQVIYAQKASSTYIYSDQTANVSGLYSPNGNKLLDEPIGTTGTKAKLSKSTTTTYFLYSTTSRQYGPYCQLKWTIEGEYSYSYNGEPYTGQLYEKTTGNVKLYTGLYGQSFSQYGYEWITPDSTHHWKHVSYLDAFTGNLFGHSNVGGIPNVIQLEKSDDTSDIITIVFWTQDVDNPNLYVQSGSAFYSCESTSGYNITDRIQGMDSAGYRWSTSASQPGTWNSADVMSSTTDGVNSNGYTNVKRGSNTYLHIKYDRKLFDIVFMNGSETVKTVKDIPFGSSISSYQSEAPTVIPGDDSHYFAGWFEDPLGTTPAKWDTTMPLGNKVVYAVTAPVEYHVMVFLNGGELKPGTQQSLSFWVPYGTILDDTNFTENVVYSEDDHHTLLGYYTDEACTIPWNFDTMLTNASLTYQYEGADDPERAAEHPDYPGDNDIGYPTTVGYLKLYAGWRDDSILAHGGLTINYVDENGYEYTDPMHYADKASVVATAAVPEQYWPTTPKAMRFDKWQLLNKGDVNDVIRSYYPTEEFIADSKYADDNLVITLIPLYVEVDPETPTHIYWYANNETPGVQKDENVQINKGVDIPTTETWTNGTRDGSGLTYEDHFFLGWARVETTDTVDPTTLGYDDLFLRWVDDHYEAQDDNGDWVPVTQVACDEHTPYHDMYAVWAKVFYVYHTGTNEVERIVLGSTTAAETEGTNPSASFSFNLAARTAEGFLYGGYYTDYAGKSAGFDARLISEASWSAAPAAEAAAIHAQAIDTCRDSGTAYAGPNDGDPFAGSTAYTVSGLNMVPEAGVVYYLKEVPDVYLRSVVRYTYFYNEEESIGSIFIACAVDSDYQELGIMVNGVDTPITGETATQLVIDPRNGDTVTYTPGALINKNDPDAYQGKVAYVMILNIEEAAVSGQRGAGNFLQLIDENDTANVYWVTSDNIRVTGLWSRTYSGLYTKGALAAAKTEVASTLTDLNTTGSGS